MPLFKPLNLHPVTIVYNFILEKSLLHYNHNGITLVVLKSLTNTLDTRSPNEK